MMKFIKPLFIFIMSILFILAASEVLIRLVVAHGEFRSLGDMSGRGIRKMAMLKSIDARINKLWINDYSARENPFVPPFPVFINKDLSNESRLKEILPFVTMEPNHQWGVTNFLRPASQAEDGRYTVTSNNHGLRGADFPLEKRESEFRILLLGSYPAFGHGVNDKETYAAVLTECLNEYLKKQRNKRQFVTVMNAGRQGGTSIMGYAFLKYEGEKFRPDLLIWDYGWIEMFLMQDIPNIKSAKKNKKSFLNYYRMLYHACVSNSWSQLCRFIVHRLTSVPVDVSLSGWRESMMLLKEWVAEHHLKTIFLHHPGVVIPSYEYAKFEDLNYDFRYLDTKTIFDTPLTSAEKEEFWRGNNWLKEFNISQQQSEKDDPSLEYTVDAIQLNKYAYKRIGDLICRTMIEHNIIR